MTVKPKVAILMYHSISHVMHGGRHPYFETTTSPEVFSKHMDFLDNQCYTVISLHEAVLALTGKMEVPDRTVVITFDDGLRDFSENAFPILQGHGFPATVFLPTGFISDRHNKFMEWKCMSWQDIRSLRGHRVDFGSHTVMHVKLHQLASPDTESQLREAKIAIEQETGDEVEAFSYPYAFPEEKREFISKFKKMLFDSGYTTGVTTIIGRASRGDCPFLLKRLPMNEYDDLLLFKAKLGGDYDWVHILQKIRKYAALAFGGR